MKKKNSTNFKKIVDQADVAIIAFNDNYQIGYSNASAADLAGESVDDLNGEDVRELINDTETVDLISKLFSENSRSWEKSICFVNTVSFGRNIATNVDIHFSIDYPEKDMKTGYLYLQNIKPHDLNDVLSQTNEFLKNLIDHSPDGIIVSDKKGKILIFNESAEKLLGYKAEEAINGVHITKIYRPGYAKEVMKMLRSDDYGGIGRLEAIESIIINRENIEIPCNLSAAVIHDRDGNEFATVGIFSDLRLRKRMQKELEDTQMKLFQSEKMSSLGKLAAGIAHEINNPLGGIMIYANMLLEDMDETDERKEDLKRIASEAERCKNIVKGLLEFSRQTGSTMASVNLNSLLEQGMLLIDTQAMMHNIKLVKNYDESLPSVKCDSDRLKQVFLNIVQNSIDSMGDKGTFEIKTSYNRDNQTARIEFKDTGEGIPEDVIQSIFDPFFTTKEVGKGTGLGLSISYGIIEDHGGSIKVESETGTGTTFIIELPVEDNYINKII